jgi:RNA polymerase sigma-70 factor (ECF subfamily)
MHEEIPDEKLMEAIAAGNQQAFRTLVVRYLPKAHEIARRTLQTRQDAEEAIQDAFGKVWEYAIRFDSTKASFGTWFYRILTNTCLDMLRRKEPDHQPIEDIIETLPDEEMQQDMTLATQQDSEIIRRAVQSLPDRQRIAVVLCYFEEMTNPEAAAVMGLHIKALEGLLVRARKTLRTQLR